MDVPEVIDDGEDAEKCVVDPGCAYEREDREVASCLELSERFHGMVARVWWRVSSESGIVVLSAHIFV